MRSRVEFIAIISLIISMGCSSGGNKLIVGNIKGPGSVEEGVPVNFTVDAKGDTGITYIWAGNPPEFDILSGADTQTVTIEAGNIGDDVVAILQVVVDSDNDGPVIRTREISLIDENKPPVAGAYVEPPEVNPGMFVQFFDESSDPDENDEIVKWEWDFTFSPDEEFHSESTDREPFIQFIQLGTYQVQLRVTDSLGRTDTLDEPIVVDVIEGNLAPVVKAYAYPISHHVRRSIGFYDDGSYDPDGGDLVRWLWDWENDGVIDAEGMPAFHKYDLPGIYNINVRVDDHEGKYSEIRKPIKVEILPASSSWVQTWGQGGAVISNGIAVSPDGFVYATGHFSGGVDFDPDQSVDWHHSAYLESSFLVKYTSAGEYLKAQAWGEAGDGNDVVLDSFGNIYIDGSYGVISFDMFVRKLNADFEFLWEGTWYGGLSFNHDKPGIALDSFDNAYVTGDFEGNHTDFDPGPGETIIPSWGIRSDVFLSKFNTSGEFQWAKTWGRDSIDLGNHIAVDMADNIYVTGWFQGEVDFDPAENINLFFESDTLSPDAFLSKFDPNGNLLWATAFGASGYDYGIRLSTDPEGHIYVAGLYSDVVDFDPGPGTEERGTEGISAYFLSRFNSSGGFQWVRSINGSIERILADNREGIYITGNCGEGLDFETAPPGWDYSLHGGTDFYLAYYDSGGRFQRAQTWGGTENDRVSSLTLDDEGNIYMTGYFTGTVDFDPGPGVQERASSGTVDGYILRLSSEGEWEY
jgi:PKD repeat protein